MTSEDLDIWVVVIIGNDKVCLFAMIRRQSL